MTPVKLEPAASQSRVKHSTYDPLRSLLICVLIVITFLSISLTYILGAQKNLLTILVEIQIFFKLPLLYGEWKQENLHLFISGIAR